MKNSQLACVVSIAGTDPSGGAGIQADIKAISATGAYAASVITALVAQNTQGVQAIQEIPADFVRQQMHSVFSDLDVQAVKIGMLHDARIIEVIADEIAQLKPAHVVFDPVMVAKDGSVLLDLDTISLLKQRLLSTISLITPNLFEAEHLLGARIASLSDMEAAAKRIGEHFKIHVLIKGGHLDGKQSSDILYNCHTQESHWLHAERVSTKNTHGTGCSLSAAIASYLAQGFSLYESINSAKQYLTQAIQSGATQHIGQGCGPIDHFYFLKNRGA
ncbi:MAG: bifunctional hydroxymethylpyrimidine kinase/phosphomethylpyrimidine kinase [Legionellaceae bacterium]|nr:bifunctional hydroxymethylpyrimidine kinase/phosphomethylpyrimidine kinase [Legionellaceae bacterium]